MSYKLISVESRKGGVGKTTAALNLAYLLKEKYHVLLLDMDVTGTSIAVVEKSKFWKQDANLIKRNGETVNILKEFSDAFLKGQHDLRFTKSGPGLDALFVEDGKINVMASELYDINGGLLYDPSLMFDQIHVFWLIEMLKEICERFEDAFDEVSPGMESVIILDNSPGYVGLGHAVHQLLMRYGPELGKMLSVSSLDIQDLESSVLATKVLHEILLDNIDGAKCLLLASNNESFKYKSAQSESFFNELALHGKDSEYAFYNTIHEEVPIWSYQALIINKVSNAVITNKISVNYDERFEDKGVNKIWKELCPAGPNECMVPSDVNLQKQFYEMTLNDHRSLKKSDADKIKRELNTIKKHLEKIDLSRWNTSFFDNYKNMMFVDKAMDRLKQKLEESIFETIASKMNPVWWPLYPIRLLFDSLRKSALLIESTEMIVPTVEKISSKYYLNEYDVGSYGGEFESNRALIFAVNQVNYILACYLLNPNLAYEGDKNLKDLIDIEMVWLDNAINGRHEGQSIASVLASSSIEKADESNKWAKIRAPFLAACSRVMDFVSDIESICRMISVITVEDKDNKYSEDVDYVSLLDKKVVTKELSFEETLERMRGALAESDYMRTFRSVLTRVIERWGL